MIGPRGAWKCLVEYVKRPEFRGTEEEEILYVRASTILFADAEIERLREAVEWALAQADCFNEKIMAELRLRAGLGKTHTEAVMEAFESLKKEGK